MVGQEITGDKLEACFCTAFNQQQIARLKTALEGANGVLAGKCDVYHFWVHAVAERFLSSESNILTLGHQEISRTSDSPAHLAVCLLSVIAQFSQVAK